MEIWDLKQAPSQTDIIWGDLNRNRTLSFLKTCLLLCLLFVLTVGLLTPLMLAQAGASIFSCLHVGFIDDTAIAKYINTLMTLCFNTIFIPLLIDFLILFEAFDTKSDRQLAILNRNFFFMMINTLFIPLTGVGTIKAFLQAAKDQKVTDWPSWISQGMLLQYSYFTVYFIQLTFLSVGWWFLDIPHHIMRWFFERRHRKKMENSVRKTPFIDTYAFDLGYHSSYTLVTYAIAMAFCILTPYVLFVATPFFFFKYYVDKYNLTFVYNSEFMGVGTIRKQMVPLACFCIITFQSLNFAILASKMDC